MTNLANTSQHRVQCFDGHYFGHYHLQLKPYQGLDFANKCVVFAGQGSVKPGMMKYFFSRNPRLKIHFDRADELAKNLQLPALSDYIFNPKSIPKVHLITTRILCLYTLEIALYDILWQQNIRPRLITGHSFGELPALVAAGVVSFEDMFAIIHQREIASPPEYALGMMLIAHAGKADIQQALQSVPYDYYFSNLNSPQETALSVATQYAKPLRAQLRQQGIKANLLRSVPQPYHTPLMQSLSDALNDYLQQHSIPFNPPKIPIYSCASQQLLTADNFSAAKVQQMIARHVLDPVDFIQQMNTLYRQDMLHFIEIGPRAVCSVFIETILAKNPIKSDFINIYLNPEVKAQQLEPTDNKSQLFLSKINQAIGKITGYQFEKLSVEDKFQEKLGIDSIKKAEVIVTVLDEMQLATNDKVSTADFETIGDTLAYLHKIDQQPEPKPKKAQRQAIFRRALAHWVAEPLDSIFYNHQLLPKTRDIYWLEVSHILQDYHQALVNITKARPQTIVLTLDQNSFNEKFFTTTMPASLEQNLYPLILFFRGFLQQLTSLPCYLVLLNQGCQQHYAEALHGLLLSVRKDHAGLIYKYIQIMDDLSQPQIEEVIYQEYAVPTVMSRYHQAQRWVSQWQFKAIESTHILPDHPVVVALGGAKGITYHLLDTLTQKYNMHLYIAGRTAADMEPVSSHLAELNSQQSHQVEYTALDATDYAAIVALLMRIIEKHGRIDVLINGTGAMMIDRLQDKSRDQIDHELLNKVLPAHHSLQAALEFGIHRVINFSSILARFGGTGQSIYACANALINSMTTAFNQKSNESSAVSINWPPWDDMGMTANQGVLQKLKEFGVSLLTPSVADDFFIKEMTTDEIDPVYYIDPVDSAFYQFSDTDQQAIQQLYGQPTIAADSGLLRFSKNFDLTTDAYLQQHTVKDITYVPLAVMVALCYGCARLQLNTAPQLYNIQAHNPLMVKSSIQTTLTVAVNDQENTCQLNFASNMPHMDAEAKTMIDQTISIPQQPIELIKMAQPYDVAEFYHNNQHSDFGLYHGPVFQVMTQAWLDEKSNLLVQLDNHRLTDILQNLPYSRLALWIDGAFQALGLLASIQHNFKALPTKIGRLTILSQVPSTILMIQPKINKIESNRILGDIVITDDQGNLIVLLDDVEMQQVG